MKRIAIIGCPGAGKSYLSRALAAKTGLPRVHLDRIYHLPQHDYYNNPEDFHKVVEQLVKKPRWIMDGNYKNTFDVRLPAADTIIYLDYPRYLNLWRTIKRRYQYHNKRRDDMPPTWREKITPSFLWYIWRYRHNERPEVVKLLAQQAKTKKVIILTSPGDTKQFLSMLKG